MWFLQYYWYIWLQIWPCLNQMGKQKRERFISTPKNLNQDTFKQANVIFETSFLVLLVVKQILSATTRTTSVYTSAIWYIILLSGCCSWLHFGNGSVFFLVIFQVLSLEFIIKRHSSRFLSSDSTTIVATFIRSSLFSLL